MPNHIATNFSVTGPTAEVERFVNNARFTDSDGETNLLSLESFLAMPKELLTIDYPTKIMTQVEIDKMWADWRKDKENKRDVGPMGLHGCDSERPIGLGITKEYSDELINKYDFNNWHSWAMSNWGSKWDVYDVADEWHIVKNKVDDTMTAEISYNTAWSPVTIAWLKISVNYPTLKFFHEFADDGGGFVGDETIVNGEIVIENECDWDDDNGIAIRERVGYYWPDDADESSNS